MNWTIVYNGTEKLVGDWKLVRITRKLVSQGLDILSFKADGALADSAPLFPYLSQITLWRDRLQAGDGSFSGGVVWFQGLVIQTPRAGTPHAENLLYKVAGPWWYVENLAFHNSYQNIFLGYSVSGDPSSMPLFGTGSTTHLFLNQGVSGSALTVITIGQQITDALSWALTPFTNVSATPPFQVGAVTPDLIVPINEVRDITCAEVIHKMLRWAVNAVTFFDYTTGTQPTFKCLRRPDMAVVNIDVSQGSLVKVLNVTARYDLQAPSVQIFYEQRTSVNGTSFLSVIKDFYPNPLPSGPVNRYHSLEFTVDIQGLQSSTNTTTAKITCDPISPEDPDWWVSKHPQYTIWDKVNPADDDNFVTDFTIPGSPSSTRWPNPSTNPDGTPVIDLGLQNELRTGNLTDWMGFQTQRITLSIMATVSYRNGEVKQVKLTYQCLSTNATSGTYTHDVSTVTAYAESAPTGLAQFLYEAVSVLQFEGSVTLLEPEVSGSLLIGQLFNLTGSANAEWSTMNAMVQSVTENIDEGETVVEFGPAQHLSAGELVDLLRCNRSRNVVNSYSMRINGT